MKKSNEKKHSIAERQKHAFEATIKNVDLANDTIKMSQNWIWSLGIAELSFLAIALFSEKIGYSECIKVIIVMILSAFVLFIVASIIQFKHILNIARYYEDISNIASKKYLNKNIDVVDKMPEELKFKEEQIVSSKLANVFFILSFLLIIVATIEIIFFLFLI